jgi:trans-aconitate methyltransferase
MTRSKIQNSKRSKEDTLYSIIKKLSSTDPKKAYSYLLTALKGIKKYPAWNILPSSVHSRNQIKRMKRIASFITFHLSKNKIKKDELLIETAAGTGILSRLLADHGYTNIFAFDKSEEMLSLAKQLSKRYTGINYSKTDIKSFKLKRRAKCIVWVDFSTNFSLTLISLKNRLQKLINNLESGGILIFDIRTLSGWQTDYFKKMIRIKETKKYQRIWVNKHNYTSKRISFDIFIREKDKMNKWQPWKRGFMIEKMWEKKEILELINRLDNHEIIGCYNENFEKISLRSKEPLVYYFILKKT